MFDDEYRYGGGEEQGQGQKMRRRERWYTLFRAIRRER